MKWLEEVSALVRRWAHYQLRDLQGPAQSENDRNRSQAQEAGPAWAPPSRFKMGPGNQCVPQIPRDSDADDPQISLPNGFFSTQSIF